MGTTGWVIVAIIVILLIAIGTVLWRRKAQRDAELQLVAAQAHREEAERGVRAAESVRLRADERIARAERERLDAEAERDRAADAGASAEEHRDIANQLDPAGVTAPDDSAGSGETAGRGRSAP